MTSDVQSELRTRTVIQVAPNLPHDVRHQLLALECTKLLNKVVTPLAYTDGDRLDRGLRLIDALIGSQFRDRTSSRRMMPCFTSRLRMSPWAELLQKVAERTVPRFQDRWLRALDRKAASLLSESVRLVVAREDACLATFAAARAKGATCLYDLPTAYFPIVHAVLRAELKEFPQAKGAFLDMAFEAAQARCERKATELALADHILVASEFVRDGIVGNGIPTSRITVIPYGCKPRIDVGESPHRQHGKHVLYVGNISLRKGVPRLLRVWKRLGAYRTHRLRLIGKCLLPKSLLSDYAGTFEYLPAVPHNRLWSHYQTARFLAFPSAADGFGLVMNEAMSCGVPVLASSNSGAPGFITPGREGLIFPFGDDDVFAAHLDTMLSRPTVVAEMGRAAFDLSQMWTWEKYEIAFRDLIVRLLEGIAT